MPLLPMPLPGIETSDTGVGHMHSSSTTVNVDEYPPAPPKAQRLSLVRDGGTKTQPRACGMPVAKRTLAELKADEKKTGLKVPADLPNDFPRGPWVVDLSKPPDHAPAAGCHDGGVCLTFHMPSNTFST